LWRSKGARTSGEADPRSLERSRSRERVGSVKGTAPGHGVWRTGTARQSSEEEPNSRRGACGALVPRDRYGEEDPEVVPNGEGGAPEANEALRAMPRNL